MLNLVTGATGPVGSHLVDALVLRGERVRALVPPSRSAQRLRELGVDTRVGNLMDSATLNSAAEGADRVFHCAGLISDWGLAEDFRQANVHSLRRVLGAATRAKASRFVLLSTTDIYGYPGRPVTESERPSPRGFPYLDSRVEAESLIWNHYRRVGLPVCVIRPASVYGPRCRLLVVGLIETLLKRGMVMIDEGNHVAGLAYVGNVVDALILGAESEAGIGRAYNVCDASDVTWRDYIHALADLAEVPRPTRSYSHSTAYALASLWEGYYRLLGRTRRPPLTRRMVELMGTDQAFPIDRAMNDLGFRPRVGFEEGMGHVRDWLRREGIVEMTWGEGQ